jgi:hypothetical protein
LRAIRRRRPSRRRRPTRRRAAPARPPHVAAVCHRFGMFQICAQFWKFPIVVGPRAFCLGSLMPGETGIRNLGNTCYMAASLQGNPTTTTTDRCFLSLLTQIRE